MKSISKKRNIHFKVIQGLFALSLLLISASCRMFSGSGSDDNEPDMNDVQDRLVGTWAYDYGYNQDDFTNEELTFKNDGTFIARFGESDYERGTYEVVNDPAYGLSVRWHFLAYGDKNAEYESDVISLYKCTFDGDDTVYLDRCIRDQTKIGGVRQEFDPPRVNIYHRIKDGTKDLLTSGKWRVNKIGTPNCDWDEEWTFNEDGTLKDVWTEAGYPTETYNGTYEVIQKNGKNLLHQTLDWGTSSPEWWYEYKACGPNLIRVQLVKSTLAGEVNDATINYYYREVETETFYYHFGNVSYKYMVPKADSYTLINHPWQLEYMNNRAYGTYEFLGWYDNPSFTGNKVTTVSGSTRDFYGKINLKTHRNSWKNPDGTESHSYAVDFPAMIIATMNENMPDPKPGDTVSVLLEATLSEEIDGWFGMEIIDYTYGWNSIAWDGRNVKSTGKKIYEIFNLKLDEKVTLPEYVGAYGLGIFYNPETCDKVISISDWKFTVLDNTKTYNITYNFGDVVYTSKGFSEVNFVLPKNGGTFSKDDWRMANFEVVNWYDNPELKGTAITSFPAGTTTDKILYAKFNLLIRGKNIFDDGVNYNYPLDIPLKSVLPVKNFNPKPGDTVSIVLEAKFANDLNGLVYVTIVDATNGGWRSIADDRKTVATNGNKVKEIFNMKIDSNEKLPTDINNYGFNLCYNPDACDDTNVISEWKITLLDDSNSYSIKYHIGEYTKDTRAPVNEDYTLISNMIDFESVHWNVGHFIASGKWYKDSTWTGDSVTTIKANSVNVNETVDVYLKPVIRFEQYINENDPSDFMYHSDLSAKSLLSINQLNSIDKMSDVISFNLSATLKNDLPIQEDGWGWFGLLNNKDGAWDSVAELTSMVTTYSNKKLNITFNLKKIKGKTMPAPEDMLFNIGLNNDFCTDKTKQVEFTDSVFTLLDDTNSYRVKYHLGDMVYTEKFLSSNTVKLPAKLTQFRNYNWDMAYGVEVVAWKDTSGNTITQIPAGNTTDVDVYLKFIPHMNTWCADEDGKKNDYYTHLPAKMLLPESVVNSLAGTKKEFTFKMTAKIDKTPNLNKPDRIGVCILDASNSETLSIDLKGGDLTATFKVKPYEDLTAYPSADELYIDFVYLDDFCSEYIKFTDFAIEVL